LKRLFLISEGAQHSSGRLGLLAEHLRDPIQGVVLRSNDVPGHATRC
jgi:hypothetical protein